MRNAFICIAGCRYGLYDVVIITVAERAVLYYTDREMAFVTRTECVLSATSIFIEINSNVLVAIYLISVQ